MSLFHLCYFTPCKYIQEVVVLNPADQKSVHVAYDVAGNDIPILFFVQFLYFASGFQKQVQSSGTAYRIYWLFTPNIVLISTGYHILLLFLHVVITSKFSVADHLSIQQIFQLVQQYLIILSCPKERVTERFTRIQQFSCIVNYQRAWASSWY